MSQPQQPIACRYIVKGRVQGVGYRYFVKAKADELGLWGYARNLDDGTVEVFAAGPAASVADLLGALQRGPRMAEVRGVDCQPAPLEHFSGFEIR